MWKFEIVNIYGYGLAADIAKINNIVKTPGIPTHKLKCSSSRLKMPRSSLFVETLDMTCHIISCMHWKIWQIQAPFTVTYVSSSTNITPITLISPHLKNVGPLVGEKKHYQCCLGNTIHGIAIDDDSISTFISAVANIATKFGGKMSTFWS